MSTRRRSITTSQKRYIYSLADKHELTDVEFNALVDATSFSERQVIKKGVKAKTKTRSQLIANMSTVHASELIEIMKNEELTRQYVAFAEKLNGS